MGDNLTFVNASTIYDIENLRKENPDLAKRYLKNLLDSRFYFVKDHELAENEAGLEDAAHRVDSDHIPDPDDPMNMKAGTVKRWQMVLEEDSNAFLFKIGFNSAVQAQALLDSWR